MALFDESIYDESLYDELASDGTANIVVPSVALAATGSIKTTGTGSITVPHVLLSGAGPVSNTGIVGDYDHTLYDQQDEDAGSFIAPSARLSGSGHTGGNTGTGSFTTPHVLLSAFNLPAITGTGSFTAKPIKLYGWVINTGIGSFFAHSVLLDGSVNKISGTGSFRCRMARLDSAGYGSISTVSVLEGTILLTGEVEVIAAILIDSVAGDIILTGEVDVIVGSRITELVGDILLDGIVAAPIAAVVVPCITGDSFTSPIPLRKRSWTY